VSDVPPASDPSAPLRTAAPEGEPRVIVRPLPKVIFFYLTWIASLVFGIVSSTSSDVPRHLGTIWMLIFALNLVVISFDFSEMAGFALFALILMLVFAGLYFGFLGFVGKFIGNLDVVMNSSFYYTMFGLFTAIYLVVFVRSRFEYWEFRSNEVLHRTGVFGQIKRYSTEDLRWFKEIPDVVERLLLGAGRMVLTTPSERTPIIIENVIGIGSVDDRITELLGTKNVSVKS
jgi:hypothetical protein